VNVRLLYFQNVRKLTGESAATLALADGATIADLMETLVQRHPALRSSLPSLLFAVNEEHARRSTVLREGDTVAVMPPFSGG
jgi:molybdopterin converting factor subunit 1